MKRLASALLIALLCPQPASALTPRPKLVLTLVIDQFRADTLPRFERRFLPPHGSGGAVGGFRYLMSEGAYYPYATHENAQGMTGPGHAAILSGSYAYQNGIPVNDWFDASKERPVYCVEDADAPIVYSIPSTPAPGAPAPMGLSPRNFSGSTVGDELKNSGYASRVVTVAIKDRAAILLGGSRADLAVWFDPKATEWVSSRFYLADGKVSQWMAQLNTQLAEHKGENFEWNAQGPGSGMSAEKSFPHSAEFATRNAIASPQGLELTETAVERVFDAMQLGRNPTGATDLLAVSFSPHDYVAHAFGPNSRELEEMTVVEDALIAKLLNKIRTTVPGGLSNVVVALTADHGGPNHPDLLQAHHVDAGHLDEKVISERVDHALTDRYGAAEGGWVVFHHDFNLSFNRAAMRAKNLNLEDLEQIAKKIVLEFKGVVAVLTAAEARDHKFPLGLMGRQIAHTYVPGRNGDVLILPKVFYAHAEDKVTHVTGYNYDRTVPLILSGFGIRPGVYANAAEVVDLAPTLTFLLGVTPPALAEGRVLGEALNTEVLRKK